MNRTARYTVIAFTAALLLAPLVAAVPAESQPTAGGSSKPTVAITLDAKSDGRVFEGIGGVSAGASSRLFAIIPSRSAARS